MFIVEFNNYKNSIIPECFYQLVRKSNQSTDWQIGHPLKKIILCPFGIPKQVENNKFLKQRI